VAIYPDAVGRTQAVGDYGTNADASFTRSSTIPSRSDTVLVNSTEYNSDGEAYKTIDPAGRDDRMYFDDAGRRTKTIENYDDGDPTTGAADKDRTVEYTYTADGLIKTVKARQQNTSDDQTTKYVYGTTLTDSDIARSDLLRAVIYPDSDDVDSPLGDGTDATYDRVEHKYNRQGEIKETKDQNASVHSFDFDKLGRRTHDRITTVGSGVDGAVKRISTTYEVRGLVEKVTSYDNATVGSGTVLNEILREYNDLGMLTKEYQEHEGAKDSSTLYVENAYDETAVSGIFTKGLRTKSVRYPNARLVHFTYGSSGSMADNLGRLDAIKDDLAGSPGATLASYTYVGLAMIVIEDYEEPDVKLDYFGGTSGAYAGFDRFNRVVDQRWYDYGASADRDRYKYGYDRASNRTYRENHVSKNLGTPVYLDEFYTYDGLNRLKNFDRGQLNGTYTGIQGTPSKEEDFTLDPLGNWSSYLQKTSGTTDLNQSRSVNKVNEISGITETTGPSWIDPAYDRNGNMTTIPKPANLTQGLTGKYDAWNRLVEVKDGTTVISTSEYDGLNRRTKHGIDSQAPDNPNGVDKWEHLYYNTSWQHLETRETTTESDQPENLQPKYQYIWSPRYIDACILRDKNTDADGLCDDGRVYILGDANHSVSSLTDAAGDAIERYVYAPYGRVTIYDSLWSATRAASQEANVLGFAGGVSDPATAVQLFRNRLLHASLGAWVTRDPIGTVQPFGAYAYASDNPLVLVDPYGLQAKEKRVCNITDVIVVADAKSKPKDINPDFKGLEGNLVQLTDLGPQLKIEKGKAQVANVHWFIFRGTCLEDCRVARYVKYRYSVPTVPDSPIEKGTYKEHNPPEATIEYMDNGGVGDGFRVKEVYPESFKWRDSTYIAVADAPGTPPEEGRRVRPDTPVSLKYNFLVQVTSKSTKDPKSKADSGEKVVAYVKYDVVIEGMHRNGMWLDSNGFPKGAVNKLDVYDVFPDAPIEAP
jgi:RHS repeat-associated protein